MGDISIIEFINGVFGKDYTHVICLHNDIINEMNRIVITGGHLTPALLVIKELQKRGNWQIFYLGRKYATEGSRTPSVESKMISKVGAKFLSLTVGRLQQKFTRYTISALLRIPFGFFQSFYYLMKIRPKVVFSFGSYVSVPVVFSAWLLGIPIMMHQQTLVKGKADNINSRFAKKIAVSWESSLDDFSGDKTVLTGNPLRQDIFKVKDSVFKSFGFDESLPLILITGGNQGSHFINVAVKKCLKELLENYNILHQTGAASNFKDYEKLKETKKNLPSNLKKRYQIKEYFGGDEWGTILNKADLIVCRAGINTLTEMLALEKKLLIIPIPWLFNNEQVKNAKMFKKLGLAEILDQDVLNSGGLQGAIEKMMKNINNYRLNKDNKKNILIPDATKKIVDELEKMV